LLVDAEAACSSLGVGFLKSDNDVVDLPHERQECLSIEPVSPIDSGGAAIAGTCGM
jgi:hypothetical protein